MGSAPRTNRPSTHPLTVRLRHHEEVILYDGLTLADAAWTAFADALTNRITRLPYDGFVFVAPVAGSAVVDIGELPAPGPPVCRRAWAPTHSATGSETTSRRSAAAHLPSGGPAHHRGRRRLPDIGGRFEGRAAAGRLLRPSSAICLSMCRSALTRLIGPTFDRVTLVTTNGDLHAAVLSPCERYTFESFRSHLTEWFDLVDHGVPFLRRALGLDDDMDGAPTRRRATRPSLDLMIVQAWEFYIDEFTSAIELLGPGSRSPSSSRRTTGRVSTAL